jgi:hypothetical protein
LEPFPELPKTNFPIREKSRFSLKKSAKRAFSKVINKSRKKETVFQAAFFGANYNYF